MKLDNKQKKLLYAWCLDEGLSIEYGKLTLCDLINYRHSNVYDNRRYQVHCEDSRMLFSMIYDEIGPAVEKFCELKLKARRIR